MNFKKNFKRFFTLSRNAEGFTLVELIVVIAILGILSVVAVPAYTKYVESAQIAKERNQLSVINSALAVACAYNQVSNTEITAELNASTGAVTVSGNAAAADIQKDYNESVAGNTFKFEKISPKWDAASGMFVDPTASGGSGSAKVPDVFQGASSNINADDKTAFNNSQFGTIGADEVLNQVGTVTDLAADLFETGDSPALQAMLGAGLGNLASYLSPEELAKWGEEGDSNDVKIANYTDSLIKQKFEQMYPGVDYESAKDPTNENYSKYSGLTGQVAANAAVLNAAKNAGSADYDTMKGLLSTANGSNPRANLLTAIEEDPSTGLAQVSAAYGMYYAYMNSQGKTVSNKPAEVLNGMTDPGFLNYVANVDAEGNALEGNKAQADLAGYTGAMNMVNSSVTTKDQAEYVVMNGFGDDGLEALMKEILGSTTNPAA